MKPTPRLKRVLVMLSSASLLLAFGALASGETSDALLRRYPYDPACPWGRIANGKGLVVRCLSEAEAQTLRSGVPVSPPAIPSAVSSTGTSPVTTAAGAPPAASAPPAAASPDEAAPEP